MVRLEAEREGSNVTAIEDDQQQAGTAGRHGEGGEAGADLARCPGAGQQLRDQVAIVASDVDQVSLEDVLAASPRDPARAPRSPRSRWGSGQRSTALHPLVAQLSLTLPDKRLNHQLGSRRMPSKPNFARKSRTIGGNGGG